MEIPFYQAKWHDIDICDIAVKLNHDFDNLANSNIYKSLYEKMALREDFSISHGFVEEKKKLSSWVFDKLKENGCQKSNILSLGCGLGLIELELLKKGIRVDLQESQEASMAYIKQFHGERYKQLNFICSEDLSNFSSKHYDVILAVTCSYCLDKDMIDLFLDDVRRVLKKGGIFIWYDTAYSFKAIMKNIYWNLRKTQHAGVFWGWIRSVPCWVNMAEKHYFSVKSINFFDERNNVLNPPKLFNIPFGSKAKWQAIVLKK